MYVHLISFLPPANCVCPLRAVSGMLWTTDHRVSSVVLPPPRQHGRSRIHIIFLHGQLSRTPPSRKAMIVIFFLEQAPDYDTLIIQVWHICRFDKSSHYQRHCTVYSLECCYVYIVLKEEQLLLFYQLNTFNCIAGNETYLNPSFIELSFSLCPCATEITIFRVNIGGTNDLRSTPTV